VATRRSCIKNFPHLQFTENPILDFDNLRLFVLVFAKKES
jgi:hypothetical protein